MLKSNKIFNDAVTMLKNEHVVLYKKIPFMKKKYLQNKAEWMNNLVYRLRSSGDGILQYLLPVCLVASSIIVVGLRSVKFSLSTQMTPYFLK